MDDLCLQKVAIPGPTLAALLQRVSCSLEDVDGLLFGNINRSNLSVLDDESSSPSSDPSPSAPQMTATVTSFISPGSSHLSFFDSRGRILPNLNDLLSHSTSNHRLLGWFSGRRKSPLRPSMREFSVCYSLSSVSPNPSNSISDVDDCNKNFSFPPCVFLLFSTPLQDQFIHTHEYRAYQFRHSTLAIEPRSIEIINIGPAFRGHYGSFTPINSGFFPTLPPKRSNVEVPHMKRASLRKMKEKDAEQKEVDRFANGFKVDDLKRLAGTDASNQISLMEEMYKKMLQKLQYLANEVEISNSNVLSQEMHNKELRHKIATSGND